jgi:hypothetical protein
MRIAHPAPVYSAGSEPTRSVVASAMFTDWLFVRIVKPETLQLTQKLIDAQPKTMLSDDMALARLNASGSKEISVQRNCTALGMAPG